MSHDWQNQESITTAVEMAQALEDVLPRARAANSQYVLPIHNMIRSLRQGLFLTTAGRQEVIDQLGQIDLLIAELIAVTNADECDASHHDATTTAARRSSMGDAGPAPSAVSDSKTGLPITAPVPTEHWSPSLHQDAIIRTLKREGRMRAGKLWDRIVPKYVDKRAHQNALRVLLHRGLVKSSGKGRATEYRLP